MPIHLSLGPSPWAPSKNYLLALLRPPPPAPWVLPQTPPKTKRREPSSPRPLPWPGLSKEVPVFPSLSPSPPPASPEIAHSALTNATSPPRPSPTGRTFAARFRATRCRRSFLAVATASTFPSRCFRLADRDAGPGRPPSHAPATLAPGSRTWQAAGVAVGAAAAPRGRPALEGRGVPPSPPPARPPESLRAPPLSRSAF